MSKPLRNPASRPGPGAKPRSAVVTLAGSAVRPLSAAIITAALGAAVLASPAAAAGPVPPACPDTVIPNVAISPTAVGCWNAMVGTGAARDCYRTIPATRPGERGVTALVAKRERADRPAALHQIRPIGGRQIRQFGPERLALRHRALVTDHPKDFRIAYSGERWSEPARASRGCSDGRADAG
jgi:hypothetical protein